MNENITPEGIKVEIGQVWRDLDKRMTNREEEVIAIRNGKVQLGGYPKTWVSIRRLRKPLWQLVPKS